MNYITRTLQRKVLELSEEYAAILITGPRQVGKTTMLQELIKENGPREYVSLDDLTELSLAKRDPSLFFQIHKPPVLIDEVQYAPELFRAIKMMIDRDHRPGDFWLTGSQLFRLMEGVQESLAGRVALLNLFSLSQAEIDGLPQPPFKVSLESLLQRKEKVPARSAPEVFEEIWKGSMPALRSGAANERNTFYSAYIRTLLERDARNISAGLDPLKIFNFMTILAAKDSQLVNYKAIADEAAINQATVKNWLHILETLGLIFYLHPYSNNTLKRLIKTPKLYFYDTGLVSYLTRWTSPEVLMAGAMNGALFENYVVSEIMKSHLHNGKRPFIYYYRDKDSREIDLVLEENGTLYPIEIKKTAHPEKKMTSSFSVLDRTNLKRGTGAILCMAENLTALDRDTLVIPVKYLG